MSTPADTPTTAEDIWAAKREADRLLAANDADGAIAATGPIRCGLWSPDPRIQKLARRVAEGWVAQMRGNLESTK